MQQALRSRHIDTPAEYPICGHTSEDAFHALISCRQARGLWKVICSDWGLPDLAVYPNCREWLLNILDKFSTEQRVVILMTLWRVWHVHNEITHHKPAPPIEASRRFLNSYIESLLLIRQHPKEDNIKGKQVVDLSAFCNSKKPPKPPAPILRWQPPEPGTLKLNVDGSFSYENGEGGTGMVLRNETGETVFLACHYLPLCHDPVDAELYACEQGIQHALNWSNRPFCVETDSAEAICLIEPSSQDLSKYCNCVNAIRELINMRPGSRVVKCARSQNGVSDCLAKFGRVGKRSVVWLGEKPEWVQSALSADCNLQPD